MTGALFAPNQKKSNKRLESYESKPCQPSAVVVAWAHTIIPTGDVGLACGSRLPVQEYGLELLAKLLKKLAE